MRVVWCVFLLVLSKVVRSEPKNYEDDDFSPLQKKVDVYPGMYAEPVPFGHISVAGFGDPFTQAKQPIDILELRMRAPKSAQQAKEILQKYQPREILFSNVKLAKAYASPRDIYLKEIKHAPPETNATKLKWYDIAEIQTRNAMLPPTNQYIPKKKEKPKPKIPPPNTKMQFFSKNKFELVGHEEQKVISNWTTCDQFAVGAVFTPKEIVDFKWTPFYIWSPQIYYYAIEHTFQFPTQKLVTEYQTKFGKYIKKNIDWKNPKLLMRGFNEMLLIAADKRGLFDAIPKHEIPEGATNMDISLPSLSLRMKIEDPYLVLTHCEEYYATIMAISGRGPVKYKEMKTEAESVKFVGPGRPVWRDFEGEKERDRIEKEAKLQEERDKVIIIDEPMPPVGQYD